MNSSKTVDERMDDAFRITETTARAIIFKERVVKQLVKNVFRTLFFKDLPPD